MTTCLFDTSLSFVLKAEGGFVDDPRDPGGMTNLGVTRATLASYRGHPVTEAEMRSLTPALVSPVYKRDYWDKVRGDDLPPVLAFLTFEFGVNAGVSRAIRLLQEAVGVDADGLIGPATLKAAQAVHPDNFIQSFEEEMKAFYRSLSGFPVYGKGWLNRVASAAEFAETLLPVPLYP
jgi:lysozyme family protein